MESKAVTHDMAYVEEKGHWMLFAGDAYYPSGGMDDYKGTYASLGACIIAYFTLRSEGAWDWGHAVKISAADGRVLERSEAINWPKAMNERDYGDVE